MDIENAGHPDQPRDMRNAVLRISAIYWAGMFVSGSVIWGIAGTDPIESAPGKLMLFACAILMTGGIAALLHPARRLSLPVQTIVCFLISSVASIPLCAIDAAIYAWCMAPAPGVYSWTETGYNLVYATSLFFGWSCLFVALLHNQNALEQQRRLALAREDALAAQMRALRYQISPHFLFNTLNSIAALIDEREAVRAERMVIMLSAFLHETLRLDPMHDVSLGDELALQSGYLSIERERFSDRMTVNIAVPDALRSVLVPSLILQPLIENAVKHGLGSGPGPVEISIRATEANGALDLHVENDVPGAGGAAIPAGMGIGLRNVAERIKARFAEAGFFSAGFTSHGRFRASLTLPLRTA